jgi:hypothetical protein
VRADLVSGCVQVPRVPPRGTDDEGETTTAEEGDEPYELNAVRYAGWVGAVAGGF